MTKLTVDPKSWEKREIMLNLRLCLWVLAFGLVFVLADKAELYNWYPAEWMTVAGIIATIGLGIAVLFAYMRYLKEIDEMQRKIIMDALALGLGVGIVGGCIYSLLVTTGYVVEEEVSDLILLMCVVHAGAIFYGMVRYR